MMDEAKRLLELLDREINAVIVSAQDKKRQQEEQSRDQQVLKDKLKEVDVERNKLRQDREVFEKEKGFLVRISTETEAKNGQLERANRLLETKEKELNTKKTQIEESEKAVNLKLTMAKDYDQKLKELEYRESLLEKEKAIDRERKEILEIREQKITDKEKDLERRSQI